MNAQGISFQFAKLICAVIMKALEENKVKMQVMLVGQPNSSSIYVNWAGKQDFWLLKEFESMREKVVFETLCYANLFIGIVVANLKFRTFFRTRTSRANGISTAIAKLIVVEEVIRVTGYSGVFAFALVNSKMEGALINIVGQSGCNLVYFVSALAVGYTYTGGLAQAFVRCRLMKHPVEHILPLKIWLLATVLLSSTALGAFLHSVTAHQFQDVYTICMGRSELMTKLLFSQEATGTSYGILNGILVFAFAVFTAEFVTYLQICVHLVKHNKSVLGLLPERTIKKRVRGNVIDLVGQIAAFFCKSFLTLSWALFALFGKLGLGDSIEAILPLCLNYGVISLVHLIMSDVLKQELKELMRELTRVFSCRTSQ